jgi:hypothetical protein
MIYDCFTFYNELNLLEIRLHELAPVVDFFVLVEAEQRFDLSKKPLYYQESQKSFENFKDKIIHIPLKRLKGHNLEECAVYQCNQIMKGIEKAKPDDKIIISDSDEIVSRKTIEEFEWTNHPYYQTHIRPMRQNMFMFYVNWHWTTRWNGSVIVEYDTLKNLFKDPRTVRLKRRHGKTASHAGWHFSQIGDNYDTYMRRTNSYHYEGVAVNYEQLIAAKRKGMLEVRKGQRKAVMVPITYETHPKYLVDNQDKFPTLIGEDIEL